MSKQSDWSSRWSSKKPVNPSTETIPIEGVVVASNDKDKVGGVVACHTIKTSAMWYHDYTDWRWIT